MIWANLISLMCPVRFQWADVVPVELHQRPLLPCWQIPSLLLALPLLSNVKNNRELTRKNTQVFKRTQMCSLEHMCVLSKTMCLKCVLLPALVWLTFRLVEAEITLCKLSVFLFAASTKPNANLAKEHTYEHIFEKEHTCVPKNTCVFFWTHVCFCLLTP